MAVFLLSAFLEIGGGWFVWSAVRERKPHFYAAIGCIMLCAYGFSSTLQPLVAASEGEFGRLDAAYGGVFIAVSFVWGRVVDSLELDLGDAIGSVLCLAGVAVILAWPRSPGASCIAGASASAANTTTIQAIDVSNCSSIATASS